MALIDLATKQDLLDLEERLAQMIEKSRPEFKRWLRSKEVCNMLGISSSSLQNLRIQGFIPYSKVGGTIFYPLQGITKVLEDHLRNSKFSN